jgi:hypothetical protein
MTHTKALHRWQGRSELPTAAQLASMFTFPTHEAPNDTAIELQPG